MIANQMNLITFVMVDIAYTEVAGLGNTFVLQISKAGGPFAPSTGVKNEIGNGWYSYILTAAECDTVGPLSIIADHALCIQQNLEYVVQQRNYGCRNFTYTFTNSVTLLPVPGAEVWFSIDNNDPPLAIVWAGVTDALGIARDTEGDLPCLDDGVYYVWARKDGGNTNAWPDTETVGP